MTESWITLNCVSNEVGGGLVGNARWSGVRIADVLAHLGVSDEADCVLQTSHDGWFCATPLATLTDDRDAMLAVAMNGRPLPIEHGFPVRTLVPGLYGYVSATKWVVDYEVTTFDKAVGYWTTKGWSAEGPVKIASRIDVPRSGDEVAAGEVTVGGVAWHQHTGIEAVEVQVDGGAWSRAELGHVPSVDTWVQWAVTLDVPEGDHEVRVRAIGKDGETQTSVVRAPGPRRLDRAAHHRDQRTLSRGSAVADDVRRPAGGRDPDPLELRAVVDATDLGVGGAGRVVDDHVAVGLEADDDQQVAVARRDRRAR